jgi:hypothetical protein
LSSLTPYLTFFEDGGEVLLRASQCGRVTTRVCRRFGQIRAACPRRPRPGYLPAGSSWVGPASNEDPANT